MNEMVIRGVRPGTKDISLTFIILDVARPTVNIFYLESCENQNPLFSNFEFRIEIKIMSRETILKSNNNIKWKSNRATFLTSNCYEGAFLLALSKLKFIQIEYKTHKIS
jgi:hypothetical protein